MQLAVPKWEIEGVLGYLDVQQPPKASMEGLVQRLILERTMLKDFLKIGARDIRALMWYCPSGAREMYGKAAKTLEDIVEEG